MIKRLFLGFLILLSTIFAGCGQPAYYEHDDDDRYEREWDEDDSERFDD